MSWLDQYVPIHHGEWERSYLLHLPGQTAEPLPLVMFLHGAGGTAAWAAEETGWSAQADRAGFALVYPEGLTIDPRKPPKFLTNPQEWNDGSGRGQADDVGFLIAVLEDVSKRIAIDRRRVYVSGFSNGAGMTFRLVAEQSDRFTAMAPVSGHCWVQPERLPHVVPTYYMMGDSDPLLPIPGGMSRTPWGKIANRPPFAETVRRWSQALGVSSEEESSPFQISLIPLHGHHWPGGKGQLGERLGGPLSDELNATEAIWEFFRDKQK
jgi:polyhydroxybutyrate depolymerase